MSAAARAAAHLLGCALLASCGHRPAGSRAPFHPHLLLGRRLLVVAPHPDDEALGAAGTIDAAVRSGAQVRVVVATDGEAGSDKTRVADLATARREETRHALAELGLGADAVSFLGFRDGSLSGAWTEAWTAWRREEQPGSADALVDALRAAVRDAEPDTVILPMALDQHPDHRALNRFALLALLAERLTADPSEVLGYLVHARDWPGASDGLLPPGCPGTTFPWTRLELGADAVARKARLIETYRTQVGHSGRLLHFAGPTEPFAREDPIRAPHAMGPTRPGLHRTDRAITIHVPRDACVTEPGVGDRLRLRFIGAAGVEERIVALAPVGEVKGGRPGRPLAPAADVAVRTTAASVRLQLAASSFGDVAGALLEVLPGSAARIGPAWVLVW